MLILEVSSWGISDTLKYKEDPFTAVNVGTSVQRCGPRLTEYYWWPMARMEARVTK